MLATAGLVTEVEMKAASDAMQRLRGRALDQWG